jgi:hypothetical protein
MQLYLSDTNSNDRCQAASFTLRKIYSWGKKMSLPSEHDTGRSAIDPLSYLSYTGL